MPDWIETALRTLFAVIVLFVMTRLLGKRQISQLSFFEYITGITIGSLAAYISLDLESQWYLGFISLSVWVLFSLLVELVQLKSEKLRHLLDSKSRMLIRDGRVLEHNMKKERLSGDDLMEALRKKNVFNLADVEFAVIESTGEVNVKVKKDQLPLTPAVMGKNVQPDSEPVVLIMDGSILEKPLAASGKSQDWLRKELKKRGLRPEQVYLGQLGGDGKLYLDAFDDLAPPP